uniref:Dolichyl-diphosphooligosaccharide--protein glycosyltransferase subunit KCP2 n=1 Tax=Onchocerca volvulus TaxID=6282 RepID=A0A8R1TKZ9_ONCVO
MANHSASALVSFLIAVIIIATGQIMKVTCYHVIVRRREATNDLAASKVGTLIAGGLGSLVFVFLLTALSNFQMFSIGKQVKAGLTDVFVCLLVAVISSATIHRVAITL